jgi:hypothetical protein
LFCDKAFQAFLKTQILFKRLAEILGNRLLQTDTIISSTSPTEISLAYGTGQVLSSPEPESG